LSTQVRVTPIDRQYKGELLGEPEMDAVASLLPPFFMIFGWAERRAVRKRPAPFHNALCTIHRVSTARVDC